MEKQMALTITWFDNGAFRIVYRERVLWLDPSINKNPDSPIKTSDVNDQADFVFTTHGDPGHFINSVEIAQKTGAFFVAPEDLCQHVMDRQQMAKERIIPLSFNERQSIDDMEIYVFEAEHPEQSEETLKVIAKWGGVKTRNAGFVIRMGPVTLCHMGDATYSNVFQEIGREYAVDIGMIPIQGRMHGDPSLEEAVESGARIVEDLNPKFLLPVIQYTRQMNRIAPVKRRLETSGVHTQFIIDKPGTLHELPF